MHRTLTLIAAIAALSVAGSASAQKLDKNGKCHDAKGHFAAMSVCKPATAKAPPNCKKGKLCGDTCISAKDVCHKPGGQLDYSKPANSGHLPSQ